MGGVERAVAGGDGESRECGFGVVGAIIERGEWWGVAGGGEGV